MPAVAPRSGHPLAVSPLNGGRREEDGARVGDHAVEPRPSAEVRERKVDREDHEPEAGDGLERVVAVRRAERQAEAE